LVLQFFSLSTLFEVVFAHGPLRGLFYVQVIGMQTNSLRRAAKAVVFALALSGSAASVAIPLMDMRAEDMLPMVFELRDQLKLNANQQTLWLQVEGKSRAILRERQSRRERMHAQAKAMLEKKDVELRDVNALIEAETGMSAAEDKQLRELWLTVNDALDDNQRRQVATFANEQMQRVEHPSSPRGTGPSGGGEGRGGHRGGGRMGGGGMHIPGGGD
jgi:uncharacterized membrane protein YgcG